MQILYKYSLSDPPFSYQHNTYNNYFFFFLHLQFIVSFFELIKMTENLPVPAYFIVTFFISRLKSSMGKSKPWTSFHLQPNKLRLRDDPEALNSASTDYGNMVKETPAAVLNPSSINDVVQLISYAYNNPIPFQIAARGQGHSVRGQAMARDGVVIDMSSLRRNRATPGITVSTGEFYADVGGEQRWIDVLNATLEYGLTPVSWTDYLYITVGGTLSNAGISGQTFRYGPQVSNVVEMDVVTGTGSLSSLAKTTCSLLFNMWSFSFVHIMEGGGKYEDLKKRQVWLLHSGSSTDIFLHY